MTEPLPISLVSHTAYCPRRAWLEAAGEHVASIAIEFSTACSSLTERRCGSPRLRRALEGVMEVEEDSVLFCDLGSLVDAVERRFTYLGRHRVITNGGSFVI